MRLWIKYTFVLSLTIAAVSSAPAAAQATPTSDKHGRAELALGYSYLHTNAPPGGCGCFSLNGGSASFAWPVKQGRFAFAADIYGGHAGAVLNGGYGLNLTSFTVGARYLPKLGHGEARLSLQPFGEVLVGVAHASGSLVQSPNPGARNASSAFAATIGGGVDQMMNTHVSFRLIQADYLLTTFDNGSNNHQNNLRLSAGLVLHF
jgi:peptidoglycan-associated lipoprotein